MSENTPSLKPDSAGIILALGIAGKDADQEALNDLLMRHYNPMAVMEAQMILMTHGLGAGLANAMQAAFGGEEGREPARDILSGLEAQAAETLEQAGREAQLKSVGVGLKIAKLDGVVNEEENAALERLLQRFGLNPAEVVAHVEEHMQIGEAPTTNELDVEEASMVFAAIVSMDADGQVRRSGPEADFLRTQYKEETAFGLMSKLPRERPADLPEHGDPMVAYFTPMVLPALEKADDEARLRALAIGLRAAEIDGDFDDAERETMATYCSALGQDLDKVRAWGAANLPPVGSGKGA